MSVRNGIIKKLEGLRENALQNYASKDPARGGNELFSVEASTYKTAISVVKREYAKEEN